MRLEREAASAFDAGGPVRAIRLIAHRAAATGIQIGDLSIWASPDASGASIELHRAAHLAINLCSCAVNPVPG